MRGPVAELRTTLFAALAVSCGTTAKEEAVPTVVLKPEPPVPAPTTVVTTRPPPAPKLFGYENLDGVVNRLGPATCSPEVPMPACAGTESNQSCKVDADCNEHPHGRCVSASGQKGDYCGCVYSCAKDADCGEGRVCVCGDAITTPHGGSVCAAAKCSQAADCEGQPCGVSTYHNGCGREVRLQCRQAGDACRSDADCPEHQQCAAGPRGFTCRSRSCKIGRPLRVEGELRKAAPVARRDWLEPVALDSSLGTEARLRGRKHYLTIAALEHGSVASFARFTLQLLALGAPSHLLAETQRAALDEVRHAKLMYGVASALGAEVGPGPVLATAPPAVDPASVLEALIEEGCIGETLGAVEAAAAARAAQPGLADALREVAADEARHAALAWQTLTWMLGVWPELRHTARAAIDRFATDVPDPPPEQAVPSLGILASHEVASLRDRTLTEVVRPLAHELTATGV